MLDLVPHILYLQCDVPALGVVILARGVVVGLRGLKVRCRRRNVRGLAGNAVGLAFEAIDQMRLAFARATMLGSVG